MQEKAEYKGPWNIPKRRAKKHPLAPKRPMSAFLKYSQKRRATVKDSNPDMSNTDVSRLLGEMWRSASQAERAPYVEQEERERAQYKEDIKNWRNTQAKLDASSRTSHQQVQNVDTPPPAPKKRRDYDNGMFRHNAVDSQEASGAASMEKHVDHRIFRPYSGSGHPVESKYYSNDHHRSYASHPHPESDRGLPVKLEPQSLRSYKALEPRSYKTLESRYYPAGPHDRAGTGSPTMMHHSSRQHPQQYGATNPPAQPQRENPHATQPRFPSSDSIQFDSFGDPEPPFNPRQTRPSSSHYFPDNYYHYP